MKISQFAFVNNSKATAVTTHQANQSQSFICTRKLVSCSTHLQSYAKVDNEIKLEKLRTVLRTKAKCFVTMGLPFNATFGDVASWRND